MDISIVIPVYNSAATIVEAMDSVVRQCVANPYSWELILVDDGSKDDSAALIEQYIAGSSHKEQIKLIKQPNGGAALARNTGIKASSGEFIAFNDSDDRWLEGKLKLQMGYLIENPNVDMVGGSHELDCFPSTFKKLGYATRITIADLLKKNYFPPPTVIIAKRILDDNGFLFDSTMRGGGEDGTLFFPIAAVGNAMLINVKVAQSIKGKQQWGDCGLSGNLVKMEKGELHMFSLIFKSGYISFWQYSFATSFSLLKFARRFITAKLRSFKPRV